MADFALPPPARVRAASPARVRHSSASFGDLVHTRWQHKTHPADEGARQR
jgi:hypothetical protein